jgi:hypothetical protein
MSEEDDAKGTNTSSSGSPITAHYEGDDSVSPKKSLRSRILDGFRPYPDVVVTRQNSVSADGKAYDVEGAAQATADTNLSRRLKARHLQMIAIGGSVGMNPFGPRWPFPILTILEGPAFSSAQARHWLLEDRPPC